MALPINRKELTKKAIRVRFLTEDKGFGAISGNLETVKDNFDVAVEFGR